MQTPQKQRRPWVKGALLAVAIAVFAGGAQHTAVPAPSCTYVAPAKGDGHPVILLPGFMTGDYYLGGLRSQIEAAGYKTYGWDNGLNLGADEKTAEHLRTLIRDVYEKNGNRPVTLVGHSLGGVYARELASAYPGMVRDVITLGSPLNDKGMREAVRVRFHEIQNLLNPAHKKLALPSTSIYSPSDWIVDWHASFDAVSANAENIEVESGHMNLPFDQKTAAIVLDRLSWPDGVRAPYIPARFSCGN